MRPNMERDFRVLSFLLWTILVLKIIMLVLTVVIVVQKCAA